MASASTFHLVIASVGRSFFDGPADSVTLPGSDGIFEILPQHEPLVTTLKAGQAIVKAAGETRTFDIQSGVVECSGERAVVLL